MKKNKTVPIILLQFALLTLNLNILFSQTENESQESDLSEPEQIEWMNKYNPDYNTKNFRKHQKYIIKNESSEKSINQLVLDTVVIFEDNIFEKDLQEAKQGGNLPTFNSTVTNYKNEKNIIDELIQNKDNLQSNKDQIITKSNSDIITSGKWNLIVDNRLKIIESKQNILETKLDQIIYILKEPMDQISFQTEIHTNKEIDNELNKSMDRIIAETETKKDIDSDLGESSNGITISFPILSISPLFGSYIGENINNNSLGFGLNINNLYSLKIADYELNLGGNIFYNSYGYLSKQMMLSIYLHSAKKISLNEFINGLNLLVDGSINMGKWNKEKSFSNTDTGFHFSFSAGLTYLLPFKIGPGDMHLLVLQNILVGANPINNYNKSHNIISGLKYKIEL